MDISVCKELYDTGVADPLILAFSHFTESVEIVLASRVNQKHFNLGLRLSRVDTFRLYVEL